LKSIFGKTIDNVANVVNVANVANVANVVNPETSSGQGCGQCDNWVGLWLIGQQIMCCERLGHQYES
jgi:hypothetical protein